MAPEKWLEIKQKILDSFEVINQTTEKNEDRKEEREIIEFNGPMGKIRLEWITRPKVLGKKTQYANRIGSNVSVDYIYSADEVTHTLKVYQWNEVQDDWQEIEAELFK